jgi:hypothetical protein
MMHIRRHTHSDRAILPKIDQSKGREHLDLRVAPKFEFAFFQDEIGDETVTPVAQDRLEEADRQRLAQVDHAKAVRVDAAPRIAEAAVGLAVTEGIRMPAEVDAAEAFACRDRMNTQPGVSKPGRWANS